MDFVIDRVTIIDKQGGLVENKFFPILEFLELEGYYEPTSRAAAVTIANFLHCCPLVHCPHLNLKMGSIPPLLLHYIPCEPRID